MMLLHPFGDKDSTGGNRTIKIDPKKVAERVEQPNIADVNTGVQTRSRTGHTPKRPPVEPWLAD